MSSLKVDINQVYVPYLSNKSRYLNLYGGSGSGKSVFASQKVLLRIMSEKDHRILCLRKVGGTLKQSIFQRFKNQVAAWGLMSEFTFRESDFIITNNPTKNQLILAGLDDEEKLKSIETITSVWIEEATEFAEKEFDQIDLRIRGLNPNYKQIILSYNPIDESHWLKARFHDRQADNIAVLKTTFKDNYFLDAEYRQILEEKASLNPNMYRIYYLGEWGREEVQRPFAYNFKIDKHVKATAVFNANLPVYFSIDFNVEPFVCLAAHIWRDGQGDHLHFFREIIIEKNGDVHEMCDRLLDTFGMAVMANCIFTGDATSRKKEVTQRNNIDAWTIINSRFRLGQRLKLPNANPRVAETRHLLNTILAFHPDVQFNPEMKRTIFELQYSEVDEQGEPIKKNRNDEKQRMDALDDVRYMVNSFLRPYLNRYKIK